MTLICRRVLSKDKYEYKLGHYPNGFAQIWLITMYYLKSTLVFNSIQQEPFTSTMSQSHSKVPGGQQPSDKFLKKDAAGKVLT